MIILGADLSRGDWMSFPQASYVAANELGTSTTHHFSNLEVVTKDGGGGGPLNSTTFEDLIWSIGIPIQN